MEGKESRGDSGLNILKFIHLPLSSPNYFKTDIWHFPSFSKPVAVICMS